jgi:hypothetical protein
MGKDYLRSLVLFHAVEQCGNFKDGSLQLSGGKQIANQIFMALPAASSDGRRSRGGGRRGAATASGAPLAPWVGSTIGAAFVSTEMQPSSEPMVTASARSDEGRRRD